jgi:O-antigen ligase
MPEPSLHGTSAGEGRVPHAVRPGTARTAVQDRMLALPAGLISALLLFQLFDYQVLELLQFLKVLFTVTPDRLVFLLIASAFVWSFVNGRVRSCRVSVIEVCMLLLAVLCTLSWFTTRPDASLPRFKWLTTLFNFIFLPFGIYLVAKYTSYSRAKVTVVLRTIVAIGVYLSLTATFEHYDMSAFIWPKYIADPTVGIQWGRSRGPFPGSNPMGEWLIVVFLATCLLMPSVRTPWRIFLQALVPLTVAGIYFTDTRSVWLSFAAVLAIAIVRGGKFGVQSRLVVLLLLVTFLVGVGSKFSLNESTLFTRRQNTVDYRISNYMTAINMGVANPATGVGYGNFAATWREYFGNEERQLTNDLTDGNHNTYLGLFAELGFPGLFLYVALLAGLARECITVRRHLGAKDDFERHFSLCALGVLTVAMIEAIFGDLRFDPTLNTLLFLFLGITASIRRTARAERPQINSVSIEKFSSKVKE